MDKVIKIRIISWMIFSIMAVFLIATWSYETPYHIEYEEIISADYNQAPVIDRNLVMDKDLVPLWVKIGQAGSILWIGVGFVALCAGFYRRN